MRGRSCCKRKGNWIAWAAVGLGALILLILVLPTWVWWLLCGVLLLLGGLHLLRR